MKNVIRIILASGLMGVFLILAACGKDKGSSNNNMNGICQAGQVSTQYGCLSQGYCQTGYGLYNNQCIPGNMNNGQNYCPAGQVSTQYGCLAQGQCQPGSGYYNGQCIPGNYGGNNGGGTSQCQQGTVYVPQIYACLPTAGCPSGYANYYNMYCIPVNNNGGTQCTPPSYYYNGQCIH